MLAPRDPLADYTALILAPAATRESQALMRAESLYRAASFAASVSRFLSWLARRPDHLIDLALVPPGRVAASSYQGLRAVPIDHIVGSQSRPHDFDRAFHPLREHDRRRWVNLAALKLLGQSLPPVDLIQVGDRYFVVDGHHRISIARALGQESIDALVVNWDLTGPLPWDPSSKRSNAPRHLAPAH